METAPKDVQHCFQPAGFSSIPVDAAAKSSPTAPKLDHHTAGLC